MGKTRAWIIQILQPGISCSDLKEIGQGIAQDKNLKENHKFILRKLWQAKYEICKIDEYSMDIK